MQILFFKGSCSWNGGKYHSGLICICEIQNGDEDKVKEISHQISVRKIKTHQKIILLPGSFLTGRNLMEIGKAQDYFNQMPQTLSRHEVVKAPFLGLDQINLKLKGFAKPVRI